MRESAAELERLQALLDRSIESAGPFLRDAFEMPDRSLSAHQLVDRLDGLLTVALATTTARGEPRVAPIGALFVHAAFHVPTVAQAARTRHLAARPAASVTCFEQTRLAVIAHGHATLLDATDPAFAELDALQVECGGESPTQWQGDAVFLRLDADRLFTYSALA
jgi:Pyridoxamine 5'-phosphate oxidase